MPARPMPFASCSASIDAGAALTRKYAKKRGCCQWVIAPGTSASKSAKMRSIGSGASGAVAGRAAATAPGATAPAPGGRAGRGGSRSPSRRRVSPRGSVRHDPSGDIATRPARAQASAPVRAHRAGAETGGTPGRPLVAGEATRSLTLPPSGEGRRLRGKGGWVWERSSASPRPPPRGEVAVSSLRPARGTGTRGAGTG